VDTDKQDEWWAAGYFDARGGYYFKSSQVTILFTDRDLEVLEKFARIIGHGWIREVAARNSNVLQVSAQADVRAVTERFRSLVTRRKLIADMDAALRDPRVARRDGQ
jgi:hypothetical protein